MRWGAMSEKSQPSTAQPQGCWHVLLRSNERNASLRAQQLKTLIEPMACSTAGSGRGWVP